MDLTLFFIVAAWLPASAFFVGIPVIQSLNADRRRAEAAGLPNAKAIMTRRFFIPSSRRDRGAGEALLDRKVWLDWRIPSERSAKTSGTIVSVEDAELAIQAGQETIRFRVRAHSRDFYAGNGAATGLILGIPRARAVLIVL